MSIRARIILTLILIALLPITIVSVGLYRTINSVRDLSITRSENALEAAGEQAVRDRALAVSAQLGLYFESNPWINPNDYQRLQTYPELIALAVQPVGETGYTSVHDRDGISRFDINPNLAGTDLSNLQNRLPQFWYLIRASLDGEIVEGYYDWLEPDGITFRKKYMVIVPIEGTNLLLAATAYIDEFSAPAQALTADIQALITRSQVITLSIALAVAAIAALSAVFVSGRIIAPLTRLTESAKRIEEGQLEQRARVEGGDEIGVLASAFNRMAARVSETIGGLEERVQSRTQEVETRARQLQAIANVSRSITNYADMGELLSTITEQISKRFEIYHAGIFLLDEEEQYAVLRAANSEGGQRMLERGHKLKVGEVGIVGYVAATGRPRIALDTGADAAFFQNPDLPETHSEIALPLKIATQVIGVLDVQSSAANAFSENDVEVLGILADQVSVAIENARLFEETRRSLGEAESTYRQFLRKEWGRIPKEEKMAGFRYTQTGAIRLENALKRAELAEAERTGKTVQVPPGKNGEPARLVVPIKLRGEVIGVVNLNASMERPWNQDEIDIVTAVVERIALSAENARLFDQTSRRAAKERLLGEISARMSASMRMESILATAVEEIGRVFDDTEVVLQLSNPDVGERSHE